VLDSQRRDPTAKIKRMMLETIVQRQVENWQCKSSKTACWIKRTTADSEQNSGAGPRPHATERRIPNQAKGVILVDHFSTKGRDRSRHRLFLIAGISTIGPRGFCPAEKALGSPVKTIVNVDASKH
jgi:hypothetical protein